MHPACDENKLLEGVTVSGSPAVLAPALSAGADQWTQLYYLYDMRAGAHADVYPVPAQGSSFAGSSPFTAVAGAVVDAHATYGVAGATPTPELRVWESVTLDQSYPGCCLRFNYSFAPFAKPDWITTNESGSITVGVPLVGTHNSTPTVTVLVTAFTPDDQHSSAAVPWTIHVAEGVPTVNNALSPGGLIVEPGTGFLLPAAAARWTGPFRRNSRTCCLTYTLAGDTAGQMPWLQIGTEASPDDADGNETKVWIHGTAPDTLPVGAHALELIATDTAGRSASQPFTLDVHRSCTSGNRWLKLALSRGHGFDHDAAHMWTINLTGTLTVGATVTPDTTVFSSGEGYGSTHDLYNPVETAGNSAYIFVGGEPRRFLPAPPSPFSLFPPPCPHALP